MGAASEGRGSLKMFKSIFVALITALVFSGCVGVTMTVETPNAPAAPAAPTRIIVTLATPTLANGTLPASPAITPTSESSETVSPDPTLVKLIADARADLAGRVSVASGTISVKSAEPVEWNDTSLGCPKPGVMYAQVITPGYRIVLEANGTEYDYHTDNTRVELCED